MTHSTLLIIVRVCPRATGQNGFTMQGYMSAVVSTAICRHQTYALVRVRNQSCVGFPLRFQLSPSPRRNLRAREFESSSHFPLCFPSDVDTRTIGSRYRLEQPQQKTTTSINLAPGLNSFSSSHRRSPPQKNQPPTMSKLSASSVRTTVKTLLLQSSLEGQATKNDDGSTVGKKRNFVETIELQIGLKNYDPQRDKRFVSLPG